MIDSQLQRRAREVWQRASRLRPPPAPAPLHFYLPATPSLGLIHALEMAWWRYRRRRLFRRHLLPLLALSDALLEDLGYRREELLWAAELPLKVDAIQALAMRRQPPLP